MRTTGQPRVILASQSRQRKILMETLGIPFEVRPADIDEKAITHDDPVVRAQLIAQAKAQKIVGQVTQTHESGTSKAVTKTVVIAADTFCFMDKALFEKPVDKAEAIRMLTALSGKISVAVTGVCVINTHTNTQFVESVQTKMSFRDLSVVEIAAYVERNTVTEWSGGFSPAYHEGMALFKSIDGSLTSFSHGFPMEVVVPALREAGVNI